MKTIHAFNGIAFAIALGLRSTIAAEALDRTALPIPEPQHAHIRRIEP